MGAGQGTDARRANHLVSGLCGGILQIRCPTRYKSSNRLPSEPFWPVEPIHETAEKVAQGQCFQDILHTVTRDLVRLGDLHKKELASLSRKVNKLRDDKTVLSEEIAKLESYAPGDYALPANGLYSKEAEATWAAKIEDTQGSNASNTQQQCGPPEPVVNMINGSSGGAPSDADAEDSTTQSRSTPKTQHLDKERERELEDQEHEGVLAVVEQRRSNELLVSDVLRFSKLRSSWEELDDETVLAFSPLCDIDITALHRRTIIGVNKRASGATASARNRMLATSQEHQHMLSLCWFNSVLHPNAHPRLFWYLMTLLALLYDVVTIPLTCFHVSEEYPIINSIDLGILVFWTLDIFMTFRTGYYTGGKVELKPRLIAMNYLQTWFLLDFMVVVVGWTSELAIVTSRSSVIFKFARFFRILRVLRLLRLAKLKQILDHIEDRINSNVMHLLLALVKLVSAFSVVVHFTACGWYLIGSTADDGWPTYDNYDGAGPKGTAFWYAAALRWTLAQINGRTDMDERRNMRERLFTCVVAGGLAIILMAVFISSITAAMMELGSIAEDRKKKVRRINEFLKKNQISSSLTALIKHHSLDNKSIEETQEDDGQILSYLPRVIQSDLLYEIRAPLLLGHPLFSSVNVESKKVMWQVCNEAMFPLVYEKDAVLFDVNDSCSRMLIVVKGVMSYSMPEEDGEKDELASNCLDLEEMLSSTKNVAEGYKVSEPALWVEWHNCGRLTSTVPSYVVGLDAPHLAKALKQHLGAHARSIMYARAYIEAMRGQQWMSDVIDAKVCFHDA